MRYFYSLIFMMLLPVIFLRLLWRSLRLPAYRKRWLERLGVFDRHGIKPGGIWIHAVSVGEVVAAIPLIKALQNKYPQIKLTVTTITPTGSQRLLQTFGDTVTHVYMPYDLPWALNNFLSRVKVNGVIIMETELWPNLFHVCKQNNLPIIIANARLSDHSFTGYMRFKTFMTTVLKNASCIAAQSKMDAERYLQLGAEQAKVQISGNLKFDVQVPVAQQQIGKNLKDSFGSRLVWVAASTHPGEEEQVLEAFRVVKAVWPQCLLILVPRHPDRFNEVARLLDKNKFCYVTRSSGNACITDTEILLGDTMGEMNIFYAAADLAFVGGSLMPIGGHNLLEPAALGVPTITGPNFSNFKEITSKLQQAGAISIVQNSNELSAKVNEWLQSVEARKNIGAKGLEVVEQNRGATNRTMDFIADFIRVV